MKNEHMAERNKKGRGLLVNLSKFTDFGLCVKTKLLQTGKNQKWLEEEVTKKTGLFMDGGYMHKILVGKRKSPKVIEAIREILEINS